MPPGNPTPLPPPGKPGGVNNVDSAVSFDHSDSVEFIFTNSRPTTGHAGCLSAFDLTYNSYSNEVFGNKIQINDFLRRRVTYYIIVSTIIYARSDCNINRFEVILGNNTRCGN